MRITEHWNVCLERLSTLCLWRFPKLTQTELSATWSNFQAGSSFKLRLNERPLEVHSNLTSLCDSTRCPENLISISVFEITHLMKLFCTLNRTRGSYSLIVHQLSRDHTSDLKWLYFSHLSHVHDIHGRKMDAAEIQNFYWRLQQVESILTRDGLVGKRPWNNWSFCSKLCMSPHPTL